MKKYRFDEHGKGYKVGETLQSWRPQFETIVSWVKPGSKILDVGCGDGVLGEKLIKEKKCDVFGFDLDSVGVAESKRRGMKTRVWDAGEKFPYQNKSFDVVICNELLELVKKPDFVLSECLRVGKTAIVEFPNFGFWFYRLQLVFGRFPSLVLYGHQWWETHMIRFPSLADFLSMPVMRNVQVKRMVCIDWKNREVSFLSRFFPNIFGRSCILELIGSLLIKTRDKIDL